MIENPGAFLFLNSSFYQNFAVVFFSENSQKLSIFYFKDCEFIENPIYFFNTIILMSSCLLYGHLYIYDKTEAYMINLAIYAGNLLEKTIEKCFFK